VGTGRIGLRDAALLTMGGIVGVGIFYNPSRVAELSDSPGHSLALWALGGLAALCGGATFAELGARLPKAGGWYVYLREAVHPLVAWLFAWAVVGVISTGAIAVVLTIALQNFAALWPALGGPATFEGRVAGSLAIVAVTAVVAAGVQAGARLQSALMALKITAILAFVAGAFWLAAPASAGEAGPSIERAGSWWARSLQGMLPVLFTCGGWHMVAYLAHEVREPRRTLPRAIVLGVVGVVLLYLALVAAFLHVLGLEGVAADRDFAGRAAESCFGATGGAWLRGAMGLSAMGMMVVVVLASPWLVVAMSKDGALPASIGALHERTGAPVRALVLQASLALAYWWLGTAELLVESISFVEWIFHGLVVVALFRLRRRDPDFDGFRAPLAAPLAYLALAVCIVPGNLLALNLEAAAIGGGVLLLATMAWFATARSRARRERAAD
jgi:APA family basic amino acid/polyamine antiporter